MPSLFNQQISATYKGLLKTTSNGILSSSLAQITDGNGNGSQLYLSDSKINFYNAYEFPTSDGSANQVLKTDGSGVLTWEDDANTGGVQVSGTPTTNQIAIWTNATTIKGMSALEIDTNDKITLTQGTNNYYLGGGNLANNSGEGNVGLGNDVFRVQTSGNFNIGIGNFAFYDFITGVRNIGIGYNSFSNTIGCSSNVGVGASTLAYSTGDNNTALGDSALGNSSFTGANNTAIGFDSGKSITTGSNNVILGSNTGSTIATTSNNIIISDGSGNNRLQFGNTGNATFSSSVTADQGIFNSTANTYAGGSLILRDLNGANPMYLTSVVGNLAISNGGATDHLTISSGGVSTFTNGTSYELLQLKTSRTDANYGIQLYHSDSTLYGYLGGTGSSVLSGASTGDLVIRGQGDVIFASGGNNRRLTIASSSGLATFDSSIILDNNEGIFWEATSGTNEGIASNGSDLLFYTQGANRLTISSTGQATFQSSIQEKIKLIASSNEYSSLSFANNSGTTQWELTKDNSNGISFYRANAGSDTGYKLTISSGGDVQINNLIKFADTIAGSAGTPQFKTLLSYQYSTVNALSTIKGGNEAGGTNGTYLKFSVNSSAAVNTPIDILTLKSAFVGGTTAQFDALIKANNGISFPNQSSGSGTVASSTLDAYEEGTYTATMTPNTSGTITLNNNTLSYTRTGRVVHVTGYIDFASVSSPVGSVSINLPFTQATTTENPTACNVRFNGFSNSSYHANTPWAQCSNGVISIYSGNASGVLSNVAQEITTNCSVRIGVTYFTNA